MSYSIVAMQVFHSLFTFMMVYSRLMMSYMRYAVTRMFCFTVTTFYTLKSWWYNTTVTQTKHGYVRGGTPSAVFGDLDKESEQLLSQIDDAEEEDDGTKDD